jgi:peptide chain release factor 3
MMQDQDAAPLRPDRPEAAPSQPRPAASREALAPSPRRTFAIISHPDAGKTTLTEKLLLFGGAIQLAGHVRARGERRRTRSDWMEIEKARGISVTSSVMTFERDGIVFNLLDTPGHSDFSEDTYRTLSAVDAAVMVIDAAKGIESQTRKLFEVCRLRDIPILTFINKVDREGLDPLALLDEISRTLALDLAPAVWPIGMGMDFQGCIDLDRRRALLPDGERNSPFGRVAPLERLESLGEVAGINPAVAASALEAVQLATGVLPAFDATAFREGHLSPVFFGSALRNFGVAELLDYLARFAPGPLPRRTRTRLLAPDEQAVTGFVFKVQANMDPNHRDRVAFVRLCSGRFERGMKLFNTRDGRFMKVTSPILFFAQARETTDEAWPGDIIGIPNHGVLRVGDTLTEGETLNFDGLPNFAPEVLRRVLTEDPMRAKQLNKALGDLAEEGVVQVFRPLTGGSQAILGAVGILQFDVLISRLRAEYGVPVRIETTEFDCARWIDGPAATVERFIAGNRARAARDGDDALVFLAPDDWTLRRAQSDWPDVTFLKIRERGASDPLAPNEIAR